LASGKSRIQKAEIRKNMREEEERKEEGRRRMEKRDAKGDYNERARERKSEAAPNSTRRQR
jgi:hypothetical protein